MLVQSGLFRDPEMTELNACHLLHTVAGISVDEAKQLLKRMGSIHKLAQAHESVLTHLPGIGHKRAAKIKAMTQWALLLREVEMTQLSSIRSPAEMANLLLLEMSLLEKEELRVVVLDTKNVVKTIDTVYKGSVNAAVVRIAEIFRSAIMYNGVSVILAHNHPSGDPTPSPVIWRKSQIQRSLLLSASRCLAIQ
ncbi:MAG: JAB domain-containing protein [Caldilineaceae bacterium]